MRPPDGVAQKVVQERAGAALLSALAIPKLTSPALLAAVNERRALLGLASLAVLRDVFVDPGVREFVGANGSKARAAQAVEQINGVAEIGLFSLRRDVGVSQAERGIASEFDLGLLAATAEFGGIDELDGDGMGQGGGKECGQVAPGFLKDALGFDGIKDGGLFVLGAEQPSVVEFLEINFHRELADEAEFLQLRAGGADGPLLRPGGAGDEKIFRAQRLLADGAVFRRLGAETGEGRQQNNHDRNQFHKVSRRAGNIGGADSKLDARHGGKVNLVTIV